MNYDGILFHHFIDGAAYVEEIKRKVMHQYRLMGYDDRNSPDDVVAYWWKGNRAAHLIPSEHDCDDDFLAVRSYFGRGYYPLCFSSYEENMITTFYFNFASVCAVIHR